MRRIYLWFGCLALCAIVSFVILPIASNSKYFSNTRPFLISDHGNKYAQGRFYFIGDKDVHYSGPHHTLIEAKHFRDRCLVDGHDDCLLVMLPT